MIALIDSKSVCAPPPPLLTIRGSAPGRPIHVFALVIPNRLTLQCYHGPGSRRALYK